MEQNSWRVSEVNKMSISFKEFLDEAKDPAVKLISILERTAKSIDSYVRRDGNTGTIRGRDLQYKYDDARDDLRDNYPGKWEEWCKKNQSNPEHTGFDLFA